MKNHAIKIEDEHYDRRFLKFHSNGIDWGVVECITEATFMDLDTAAERYGEVIQTKSVFVFSIVELAAEVFCESSIQEMVDL